MSLGKKSAAVLFALGLAAFGAGLVKKARSIIPQLADRDQLRHRGLRL